MSDRPKPEHLIFFLRWNFVSSITMVLNYESDYKNAKFFEMLK